MAELATDTARPRRSLRARCSKKLQREGRAPARRWRRPRPFHAAA
uniref:Uncharacterized protein n=1 Tax=Arundo donax TaxID=35708 RepID=A0A0A9GP03_ARUDO